MKSVQGRVFASVFLSLLLATLLRAEPPKKGRVLCEGADCTFRDVPTGSASSFLGDLADRVKRRIEVTKDEVTSENKKTDQPKRKTTRVRQTKTESPKLDTNLPVYYQGIDRSQIEASDNAIVVPKNTDLRLKGLKSGDAVWAVIEQEITASPNVPSTVRAFAISGPFKGGIFLGEATLDHDLKRVLLAFTKLRFKDRDAVYSLKGAGHSPRGSVGLEGEYVSHTGKFFIAELASAAAAGFLDSTINRNQTGLGTYIEAPSLANSGKTAAVSALSKTTERMADSVRTAPEYTRTPGYQEIQIIIQEDPVEIEI